MRALLALALLAIAACGGGASPASVASPSRPVIAPTATPINVDDMMGGIAQQTVFVASSDGIAAVTLLNHFVRYTIPTAGVAQAAGDSTGQYLYVVDRPTGAAVRLRTFDIATGTERASRTDQVAPASDHAVAASADGRLLVLRADATRAWVDAYDWIGLTASYRSMEVSGGCGDRLLASASRVAIVCLASGAIALSDAGGAAALVSGTLPQLAGAAMTPEGTLYVVTADQRLAVVAPGATKLLPMTWPSEWSGTVVPDGISVHGGYAAIAERTDDGTWVRVFETANLAHRHSSRLAGVPQGGLLARFPFGYYAVGTSIRHVDLTSGLLETMAEVGAGARPLAVVDR